MAVLRRAIDDTTAGRGRVVLLGGEAGIGKSRLAAEAAEYAAGRGLRMLGGACFSRDRACPYALFFELLRAPRRPDAGGG
jgi:predicted ATPase